jgi:hypothetical protein
VKQKKSVLGGQCTISKSNIVILNEILT